MRKFLRTFKWGDRFLILWDKYKRPKQRTLLVLVAVVTLVFAGAFIFLRHADGQSAQFKATGGSQKTENGLAIQGDNNKVNSAVILSNDVKAPVTIGDSNNQNSTVIGSNNNAGNQIFGNSNNNTFNSTNFNAAPVFNGTNSGNLALFNNSPNSTVNQTINKATPDRVITPEQKASLLKRLAGAPKGHVSIGAQAGDGETQGLGRQMRNIFTEAGYKCDIDLWMAGPTYKNVTNGFCFWFKDHNNIPAHFAPIFQAFESVGLPPDGFAEFTNAVDNNDVQIYILTNPHH